MTVIAWTFLCGIADKEKTSGLALLLTFLWAIAFDVCIMKWLLE